MKCMFLADERWKWMDKELTDSFENIIIWYFFCRADETASFYAMQWDECHSISTQCFAGKLCFSRIFMQTRLCLCKIVRSILYRYHLNGSHWMHWTSSIYRSSTVLPDSYSITIITTTITTVSDSQWRFISITHAHNRDQMHLYPDIHRWISKFEFCSSNELRHRALFFSFLCGPHRLSNKHFHSIWPKHWCWLTATSIPSRNECGWKRAHIICLTR